MTHLPKKAESGAEKDEGQDFAPHTDNDHRKIGEWKSRYPFPAYLQIILETAYILGVFLLSLAGIAYLRLNTNLPALNIPAGEYLSYQKAAFALLGGLLGGVLFAMKWLYHSVAHGIWNQDRCLWRLLTPLISAGLAFAFFIVIKSGLVTLINSGSADQPSTILAISFLVGYFSDTALAKMYEIATTLFGTVKGKSDAKKPVGDKGGHRSSHESPKTH